MNSGVCAPTVAQALLPYPQFCSVLQGLNENHGNSIYHSFQLKAEKRYSNGLYMLVSYTNSKIISDVSDNTQQPGGSWNATQGVISPYEKQRARSISSDDVPQIISAAFVYDLPLGRGKRYLTGGFANALVGGWQVSPIIHWKEAIRYDARLPQAHYQLGRLLEMRGNHRQAHRRPRVMPSPLPRQVRWNLFAR